MIFIFRFAFDFSHETIQNVNKSETIPRMFSKHPEDKLQLCHDRWSHNCRQFKGTFGEHQSGECVSWGGVKGGGFGSRGV